MNILIDTGHPAHVHYYRNLAQELIKSGHKIIWLLKDIEVAKRLMVYYDFNYYLLPAGKDSLVYKIIRQIKCARILLKICMQEKVDLAIGTSVSIAHVSRISPTKSIIFDDDDDEVQPLITKYVNPYADTLLSPDILKDKRRRKDTMFYPGYHELAYLHPKRYAPNPEVLKDVDLKIGENYFIMRFNVFKAHHDVRVFGLSLDQKLKLIEILKPHGKIFITTEREIEPELKDYQLILNPGKIHSLLAFSGIFISDSQTMTSEAAVLGVPSLRCNSFAGRISNLEEMEHRYGLTFSYQPNDFEKMLDKLNELLTEPNLKEEWQRRRQKMLSDKIDVTAFWTWFINHYPESVKMVRDEEDFWEQFK